MLSLFSNKRIEAAEKRVIETQQQAKALTERVDKLVATLNGENEWFTEPTMESDNVPFNNNIICADSGK